MICKNKKFVHFWDKKIYFQNFLIITAGCNFSLDDHVTYTLLRPVYGIFYVISGPRDALLLRTRISLFPVDASQSY